MEYYLAIKKILSFVTKWTYPKGIMLGEVTQRKKNAI